MDTILLSYTATPVENGPSPSGAFGRDSTTAVNVVSNNNSQAIGVSNTSSIQVNGGSINVSEIITANPTTSSFIAVGSGTNIQFNGSACVLNGASVTCTDSNA